MQIYLASSWRNTYYPEVVRRLQTAGQEVYDFRNPPSGDAGFHWDNIDSHYSEWTPKQYLSYLPHPLAERQFKNDIEAMQSCDACVLLLPCGKSAHTEAGWFAGQGKPVYVLIPDKDSFEPELMYKLFTKVYTDVFDLQKDLYNEEVRKEIHRLNPNLNEDDWNEIERELAFTDERQMRAATYWEYAPELLL